MRQDDWTLCKRNTPTHPSHPLFAHPTDSVEAQPVCKRTGHLWARCSYHFLPHVFIINFNKPLINIDYLQPWETAAWVPSLEAWTLLIRLVSQSVSQSQLIIHSFIFQSTRPRPRCIQTIYTKEREAKVYAPDATVIAAWFDVALKPRRQVEYRSVHMPFPIKQIRLTSLVPKTECSCLWQRKSCGPVASLLHQS